MDDLISRAEAIKAVNDYLDFADWKPKVKEILTMAVGDVEKMLKRLPSAQPEQKKGRWKPHEERSREYIGTALVSIRYDYWFCDTCGYRVENGQPMYNFCPNCGADMRGKQE